MRDILRLARHGALILTLSAACTFAQPGTDPYSPPAQPMTPEGSSGYGGTEHRDDGDHNLGWVGLLGLAGLAGLMRRNRPDVTTTTR